MKRRIGEPENRRKPIRPNRGIGDTENRRKRFDSPFRRFTGSSYPPSRHVLCGGSYGLGSTFEGSDSIPSGIHPDGYVQSAGQRNRNGPILRKGFSGGIRSLPNP